MPYVSILAESSGGFTISSALSSLTDVFTWGITTVTSNPVLAVVFVVPLAGVAVGLIKKFKNN